jgi:hypothetical protein
MTLKLRLSLILLAAAAITAVFLTQRPLPAPAQAAAYSGVAQIDGPLQLDLTLSPPSAPPAIRWSWPCACVTAAPPP